MTRITLENPATINNNLVPQLYAMANLAIGLREIFEFTAGQFEGMILFCGNEVIAKVYDTISKKTVLNEANQLTGEDLDADVVASGIYDAFYGI